MKRIMFAWIAALLVLGLLGCGRKDEQQKNTTTGPAVTEKAAAETTAAVTETTEPESGLLTRCDSSQVCIGIMPTEVGYWRYAVIPDQEAAVAAFEKAVNAKYSDEWWIKGDKTIGLMVAYNGELWDFVDSGELVCALGRVKAEDAAELYQLCAAAAKDAGWKDAVQPEQLTGIVSAVLRQEETEISLTDPDKLEQLEIMLSAGKFSLGGFGCPFNAVLTVELETGESLPIALATDSCGVWMSEGNYYEFSNDSQPLFDLFGVTFPFGELTIK